jgi:hypothetical protein
MPVFTYLLFALIAASGAPATSDVAAREQAKVRPVTCTFSNPAYSGYCRQTASATGDETANDACQEILACLNNVQCTKTYCDATQIRGGWKLVSAKERSDGD